MDGQTGRNEWQQAVMVEGVVWGECRCGEFDPSSTITILSPSPSPPHLYSPSHTLRYRTQLIFARMLTRLDTPPLLFPPFSIGLISPLLKNPTVWFWRRIVFCNLGTEKKLF